MTVKQSFQPSQVSLCGSPVQELAKTISKKMHQDTPFVENALNMKGGLTDAADNGSKYQNQNVQRYCSI